MYVHGVEAKYGIGRSGFMPLLQSVETKYGIIFKMLSIFYGNNHNITIPYIIIKMLETLEV